MPSDKFNKYAQGAKEAASGSYDSDKDLPAKVQKDILDAYSEKEKNKIRTKAWNKAGAFKNLKRTLKSGWKRDIRKKPLKK